MSVDNTRRIGLKFSNSQGRSWPGVTRDDSDSSWDHNFLCTSRVIATLFRDPPLQKSNVYNYLTLLPLKILSTGRYPVRSTFTDVLALPNPGFAKEDQVYRISDTQRWYGGTRPSVQVASSRVQNPSTPSLRTLRLGERVGVPSTYESLPRRVGGWKVSGLGVTPRPFPVPTRPQESGTAPSYLPKTSCRAREDYGNRIHFSNSTTSSISREEV